jgi:hypothetical protein
MDRIWIYQADRTLSDAETKQIENELAAYADRWTAHGKKLKASYEVRYNRFVILKVENGFDEASGCSIDDSVRFLKQLEQQHHLSLFDRSQMAYLQDSEIKSCALNDISGLYKNQVLRDDTLIFDNTVNTGDDYQTRWQKPLKESGYFGFVR